jgi:hypothetical protein
MINYSRKIVNKMLNRGVPKVHPCDTLHDTEMGEGSCAKMRMKDDLYDM